MMKYRYRIKRKNDGFEPQMLYNCGAVNTNRWFPLNKNGYWSDPDAYSFGIITKDSVMSLEEATTAIANSKRINQQ